MRSLSVKKHVALLVLAAIVMAFFASCGDDSFAALENASIGSYITFGHYEQDNYTSNGKEEIEWLVLDIQDGKALVISKYVLDGQPYNERKEDVTWETCTLRTWLNSEFYNIAFSSKEKTSISEATISIDSETSTQDKVFLLSEAEANEYFVSDSARRCEPTDYAVANGVRIRTIGDNEYLGNCSWWLRANSGAYNSCAVISAKGRDNLNTVDCDGGGVRPAMWIDLGA